MLVLISLLVSIFLVKGNTHRSVSNAMPLLSSLLGPLSIIYASMMCSLCTCPVHGITISLDFPKNDLTPVDLGWKVVDHVSVHSSWKVIDEKLQQTIYLSLHLITVCVAASYTTIIRTKVNVSDGLT